MTTTTTIKCPNCNTNIDVNDILYHQLEDELKEKEFKKAKEDLRARQEAIKEQQESN